MRRIEQGWIDSKQCYIRLVTHDPVSGKANGVYLIERHRFAEDDDDIRITGPGARPINQTKLPMWIRVA